jgi:acyl-coenzyme A synthetase/AMP-(fatty) acid ligase
VDVPLLNSADPARPILWAQGRAVSVRELLARVTRLAAQLPEHGYLVNLCEQRDAFLTAYCAALLRAHPNLLPAARAHEIVEEVMAAYAGSYRCDDALVQQALEPTARASGEQRVECDIRLPATQLAEVAFTSGSTGRPTPHDRHWGHFLASTALTAASIRECLVARYGSARPWIVATVPPQHMYGTETSILLPLLGDMAVHSARPLLPGDVAAALAEIPEPRVLVTAPVHLRALAASGQTFPRIALVTSATAPLDVELATTIERTLATSVLEIFGSTETGVIATRRTALEQSWRLQPGVVLRPREDATAVEAPWLEATALLSDVVELESQGRFVLRGRSADLIDVAGKRASLADLTRRLLAIPGVEDAVVLQPEGADDRSGTVHRVAALVVAPEASVAAIREQLGRSLDPAFIPRPLVRVPALPRNEAGKLVRSALLALLASHEKR